MDEPGNKSVKEIYLAALQQAEGPEREAYLTQACGRDPRLREQVIELLQLNSQAGDFLETPVPGVSDLVPATRADLEEKPGDKIGPYKLLQKIGEGGCGVVYMAEQETPIHRRWPSRSSSWAWIPNRSSPASKPNARRSR